MLYSWVANDKTTRIWMKSHLNLQRIYVSTLPPSPPHSQSVPLVCVSFSCAISEIANSVTRLHSIRSQTCRIIHVDQVNVWCRCECIDKNVFQSNYPLYEGNRHVNGRWNEWKIMCFYMTLISFGWFDFQFIFFSYSARLFHFILGKMQNVMIQTLMMVLDTH